MFAALTQFVVQVLNNKDFQKEVIKGAIKGVAKEIVKQQGRPR